MRAVAADTGKEGKKGAFTYVGKEKGRKGGAFYIRVRQFANWTGGRRKKTFTYPEQEGKNGTAPQLLHETVLNPSQSPGWSGGNILPCQEGE